MAKKITNGFRDLLILILNFQDWDMTKTSYDMTKMSSEITAIELLIFKLFNLANLGLIVVLSEKSGVFKTIRRAL